MKVSSSSRKAWYGRFGKCWRKEGFVKPQLKFKSCASLAKRISPLPYLFPAHTYLSALYLYLSLSSPSRREMWISVYTFVSHSHASTGHCVSNIWTKHTTDCFKLLNSQYKENWLDKLQRYASTIYVGRNALEKLLRTTNSTSSL